MAHHEARISWARGSAAFTDNRYSRGHVWQFDGGVEVQASSSPSVVPLPYSLANAVDPEEAFVASLSSCHMLWFLSFAVKERLRVDAYVDNAVGVLAKNEAGKLMMTRVTLRPEVTFSGARVPTREEIEKLHHAAHEACFLATSVKTDVVCEPVFEPA